MSRKFITAIAVTSIALTAFTAQPSFAGSRDRDKAILGIAGFLLLGAAIADSRKDRRKQHTTHNSHGSHSGYSGNHGYNNHSHNNQWNNNHNNAHNGAIRMGPKPVPPRVRKMTLPAKCVKKIRSHGNTLKIVGNRCLQNNYRWVNKLPNACFMKVRTRDGARRGYQPRCLKRHGFRFQG